MAVHVVDFIKKLSSRHLLLFVWLMASSLAVSCEEPEPGPVDPEDLPAEIADELRQSSEQFREEHCAHHLHDRIDQSLLV